MTLTRLIYHELKGMRYKIWHEPEGLPHNRDATFSVVIYKDSGVAGEGEDNAPEMAIRKAILDMKRREMKLTGE